MNEQLDLKLEAFKRATIDAAFEQEEAKVRGKAEAWLGLGLSILLEFHDELRAAREALQDIAAALKSKPQP